MNRKCKNTLYLERFQLLHNRKAQGPTGLVLIIGGITILVLIIFILAMIQIAAAEREIERTKNKIDDQIALLNYLRTPSGSSDIAEEIVKYKMTQNEQLKEKIELETKQILDKVYDGTKESWRIRLDNEDLAQQKPCSKIRSAKQEIVMFDGERTMVELIICN
ncbi:hypothetical protein KY345_04305 [Candidatus Woesearchaeota archaeon]|nr:hypothetical protein [Candidatus Woesearchaeota archaeon]